MDLKEQLEKLKAEARGLYEKVDKGAISPDEEKRFDSVLNEIDAVKAKIALAEKAAQFSEEERAAEKAAKKNAETRAENQAEAATLVPRSGKKVVSEEYEEFRAWLRRDEKRTVAYAANRYAPVEFAQDVIEALEEELFIRRLSPAMTITNAEGIAFTRKSANAGTPVWGATVTAETGLAFDSVTLRPTKLPQAVKIDETILKVAGDRIDSIVKGELVQSIARVLEYSYLNGDGLNNTAQGIFDTTHVNVSQDVTVGDGLDIGAFVKAKNSMPSAYKDRVWVMHPDMWTRLESLVDGADRLFILGNPREGEPQSLLGIPVYLSVYAPNVYTDGEYAAALVDWKRAYKIVDVEGVELEFHKDSTLSEAGLVEYIGKLWTTGGVVDIQGIRRIKLAIGS